MSDAWTPPNPEDVADALHVLGSVSVEDDNRVRSEFLPTVLGYIGDADPEDVPEYDDLPADAGKWTTAASLALYYCRGIASDPEVKVFRRWLEVNDTTEPYDVKTARIHEPERGRYVYVMVNRLDGRGHVIGEMGFTGVYFHFSVMSQNEDFRLTRLGAYEIQRDHTADWFPESNAYRFINGLDSGSVDWTDISDGDHLTPEDVDELTEDGDGDD